MAAGLALTGCEFATVVGIDDPQASFTGEVAEDDEDDGVDTEDLPDIPEETCDPPAKVSCDADSDDPLQVVGLDCVGGIPAAGSLSGPTGSAHVFEGPLGPYEPREGSKLLALSTGRAAHLALSHAELATFGCDDPVECPSTSHDETPTSLPAPLTVEPVDALDDCHDDPSLVGMGDCSNSLHEQLEDCGGTPCELLDYTELRLGLSVPPETRGLAFDFAFMSVEWPDFLDSAYNDMFVAWLESEGWTGNISFDDTAQPITVNAGFTNYTEELAGMAMEGHAGTRWLTTDVGVQPGENLVLILAVFDVTDAAYDSAVLIDGFRWTCSGAPPKTIPVP